MAEIKCPHCGESFTVDEAGYAAIVSQVRGYELEKEAEEKAEFLSAEKDKEIAKLETQIKALEESGDKDIRLAVAEALADKEKELNELRLEEQNNKAKYEALISAKDEEISFYKDFKAKESTKMIGENLDIENYKQNHTIEGLNTLKSLNKILKESKIQLKTFDILSKVISREIKPENIMMFL